MYAEVDFLLALIKDDDWLGEPAERIYSEHRNDLWTSHIALVELMQVAYREDRDVEHVVTSASSLLDVNGPENDVLAAATYVSDRGFTPMDALHLVLSGDDRIVSSDQSYDGVSERLALEEY